MFDTNYLVHFLVADSSDSYYLSSGLELNLHQRIGLELQKEFAQVIFLRNSGDGPRVYDKHGDVLEEYTKAGFFKNQEEVCKTNLLKKLKESGRQDRTAVIAELGTFCELMQDKKEALAKLGAVGNNDRGIVILLVPQTVDSAVPLLVGPESIFTEDGKGCLCSRLQYVKQQGGELFCNLNNSDQFIFFSELTESVCRDILINAQMAQTQVFLDKRQLNQCAVLMHRLCTCRQLRVDTGLMEQLPDNPKFQELYRWACERDRLQNLSDQAEELLENRSESLQQVLDRRGYHSIRPQIIRRSDDLVKDVCALSYPPKWWKSAKDKELGRELTEVQNYIFFPRTELPNPAITQWLKSLVANYQEADRMQEPEYLNNALKILCFVARHLYLPAGQERELMESRKEAFEAWLKLARNVSKEWASLEYMQSQQAENQTKYLEHRIQEQKIKYTNVQELYRQTMGIIAPLLNDSDLSQRQLEQIALQMTEQVKKAAQVAQSNQPEQPAQLSNQVAQEQEQPVQQVQQPLQEVVPVSQVEDDAARARRLRERIEEKKRQNQSGGIMS